MFTVLSIAAIIIFLVCYFGSKSEGVTIPSGGVRRGGGGGRGSGGRGGGGRGRGRGGRGGRHWRRRHRGGRYYNWPYYSYDWPYWYYSYSWPTWYYTDVGYPGDCTERCNTRYEGCIDGGVEEDECRRNRRRCLADRCDYPL